MIEDILNPEEENVPLVGSVDDLAILDGEEEENMEQLPSNTTNLKDLLKKPLDRHTDSQTLHLFINSNEQIQRAQNQFKEQALKAKTLLGAGLREELQRKERNSNFVKDEADKTLSSAAAGVGKQNVVVVIMNIDNSKCLPGQMLGASDIRTVINDSMKIHNSSAEISSMEVFDILEPAIDLEDIPVAMRDKFNPADMRVANNSLTVMRNIVKQSHDIMRLYWSLGATKVERYLK